MRIGRRHTQTFLFGAVVALCVLVFTVEFRADGLVSFSHTPHMAFQKNDGRSMACTECHDVSSEDASPSLKKQFCNNCHQPPGPPTWKLPGAGRELIDEIKFKHKAHQDAVNCEQCHGTTLEKKHEPGTPLVTPDRCLSCHLKKTNKKRIPKRACGRCHGTAKNRIAPENHKKTWRVRHGQRERWSPALGHGKRCSLCHSNASCVTCHRTERPRDHAGLWRLRMHGTNARWDRDRCKTCHQTGACISCHRRSPPQNHRGAWKSVHGPVARSKSNEHCVTCHSPAWCADCHRGASR